ncbi:MAG TPA: HAMP domain-containing sensor histidine kinase, partial [Glaciihabitans sp.]|nr:HAMP domain-containing sensor histidine kinase [Glaciihabitans sp.]
ANASHELRTPLAVMNTMLDVAHRSPQSQDYPTLVERLRITNDRAIGLTESLLRLADADAVGAVATPVNLADVVRLSLIDTADDAANRAVTITSYLETAVVIGDAELLGQLVTNVVQNAIRHSGSAGHARISTHSDSSRRTVVLQVESSGESFSADDAARLTEPFLRGAGRIASGDRGYGLGLALVQRITDLHGGMLAIAPREGGGLTLNVELPVSPAREGDPG